MNYKIKAVVATLALTASTAHAGIDTFDTGDGELFVVVRDNNPYGPNPEYQDGSVIFDLGINISDFDGSKSQRFTTPMGGEFILFGSFDYSWAIMAGDSTGTATNELNYLTTAATGQADALGTVTNEQLIDWSAMDAYVNDANNDIDRYIDNDIHVSKVSEVSYFKQAYDTWNSNSPVSATGTWGDILAVSEPLSFYHLTNSGSATDSATKNKPVTVNTYPGIWTLDMHGTLTYTVIPVPSAVWLLGSALIGLLGVSLRHQQV
jgi:hypothetical protein